MICAPLRPFVRFVLVLPLLVAAACAEPPEKEIHQAQGAINAARAAGAETFAAAEYEGAVQALEKAQEAVSQRDYRLALSQALDARERAEAAARTAADQKARARADAERAWQSTRQALLASKDALAAAGRARVSERRLEPSKIAIDQIEQQLSVLRERIDQGDFVAASSDLEALASELERVRSEIDAAVAARASSGSPGSRRG